MPLDRSLLEWLAGSGSRQRLFYLLAAVAIALVVSVIPDDLVSAYVWLFGGLGVGIGLVSGAQNYGVLTGFLGTAPYVTVVGQAAYLGQPMPNSLIVLGTRGLFVLTVATLGLLIPSYLIGVCVRIITRRRSRSRL